MGEEVRLHFRRGVCLSFFLPNLIDLGTCWLILTSPVHYDLIRFPFFIWGGQKAKSIFPAVHKHVMFLL